MHGWEFTSPLPLCKIQTRLLELHFTLLCSVSSGPAFFWCQWDRLPGVFAGKPCKLEWEVPVCLTSFSLVLLLPMTVILCLLLLFSCFFHCTLRHACSFSFPLNTKCGQPEVLKLSFFSPCVGDLVAKSGHYWVISSDGSFHCSYPEERCPADTWAQRWGQSCYPSCTVESLL